MTKDIDDIIREEIKNSHKEYDVNASLAIQFILQAAYSNNEDAVRANIRIAIEYIKHYKNS